MPGHEYGKCYIIKSIIQGTDQFSDSKKEKVEQWLKNPKNRDWAAKKYGESQ